MKRLKYLIAINPLLPRDRVPLPNDMVSFLPMERIGEDGSLDLSEVRPACEVSQGYTAILDGDLVIAKITPCFENGKGALCLGLQGGVGFGTTELIVLRAKQQSDLRFLYWLTRSHEFRNWGEAEMRGSAWQKRVTEEFVANFLTIELNKVEQRRIAAYLDEQTEKIDRLMDMRRRQMALLKEQRSALIQQAVTRGLNPNVPMKDSGLPWLGEIPEHWEIVCLKHLCSHIVDCLHATPDYTDDGEYPAIRTADIEPGVMHITKAKKLKYTDYLNQIQRLAPKGGDIVYSREGERFGIAACVPPNVDLCISQRMMHFRCRSESSSEFVMWQLNTHTVYIQALQRVFGATSPHINVETVRNYLLTEPPLSEQREIVAFINAETQKTDRLLLAYDRQLTLLTEYRAALIHECVTGQRLIPEAASL